MSKQRELELVRLRLRLIVASLLNAMMTWQFVLIWLGVAFVAWWFGWDFGR